jgi:hypothetical protein
VADAIREIESLYPVIEKLGKVKREQFEIEEGEHFNKKLGVPPAIAAQIDDLYKRLTGVESVALREDAVQIKLTGNIAEP